MDLFGDDTIEETGPTEIIKESLETDFSHPRKNTFLIGHTQTENEILDLWNSSRMPHGIILSGTKGIGKATLAYKLTRFLLSQEVHENQDSLFGGGETEIPSSLDIDSNNPITSKVASGGHPDLLTIERLYDTTKNKTAESLAVSELRKIEPFLRMTSSDGGWRVVIIDDADTMNRNAQNALLKILEEPPKNTLIILITHRLGALIPTIRSRTRLIKMHALNASTLSELLEKQGHTPDQEQAEIITAMAEGSLGKAQTIIEDNVLESFLTITAILSEINWPAIHILSQQLARPGQEKAYQNFIQTLLWVFKTLAFAKARGRALEPEALNQEPFSSLLSNSSLASLLQICENLSEHFDQTERTNLDKKQGVLGAFELINKNNA